MAQNYACLCCGYLTLPQQPPETWEICPVCFWEDVPISSGWIQNRVALRQAQRTFLQIGVSSKDWLDDVRPPTVSEARLPHWQSLDEQDTATRETLIHDITDTFRAVRREDGITLHQAHVLDGYGSEAEQAEARALDTDSYWWDVPDAVMATLPAPLNFLDPVGFRYYIPAYMIWTLKHHRISQSFTIDYTIYAFLIYENSREHTRQRFELMNGAQKQVICRFLRYFTTFGADAVDSRSAQQALDKYWSQFCDVTAI